MDDPAGREQRVPLSEPATALLHHMASIRVNEFAFPSLDARSRGPLSNMALATVLRRMGEGSITVHGFRSTLRDWCGEETRGLGGDRMRGTPASS